LSSDYKSSKLPNISIFNLYPPRRDNAVKQFAKALFKDFEARGLFRLTPFIIWCSLIMQRYFSNNGGHTVQNRPNPKMLYKTE